MVRSLKERYEHKRLRDLRERLHKVDMQIITEERAAKLIIEAMDDDDLNKVTAIVQKLSTLKTPELPKLTAAIEQAEAELNKFTGGGPLTKVWSKLKGKFGIDNPVVKVTVFADALEKGFSQIPQILKNNGVDLQKADLTKSLVQMLGRVPEAPKKTNGKPTGSHSGKSPFNGNDIKDTNYRIPRPRTEGMQNEDDAGAGANSVDTQTGPPTIKVDDKPAQSQNNSNVEQKIKNITAQLQKALSPGGIFGAFKKVPYVNSAELAQELVRAPLNVFSRVAKKIMSGAKAAEVAPDMKDQASGAGDAETKGTGQSEPAKQTSQTNTSAPTKDTTGATGSTATGEKTPSPQGGGTGGNAPNYTAAKDKLVNFAKTLKGKKDYWEQFAKKLVDAGLDVNKI